MAVIDRWSLFRGHLCNKSSKWDQKWWSLWTGGRFSEVIYVIKAPNGAKKWWSLWTGGRYSEVVVSSALTVSFFQALNCEKMLAFADVDSNITMKSSHNK